MEAGPEAFLLRPVTLGDEFGGLRVLTDGIRSGEKIVVDGAFHLNNERVRLAVQGVGSMLHSFVHAVLRQRLVIVVVAAIGIGFGMDAARKLSVDAFPGCHQRPGAGRHRSPRQVPG